MKKSFCICFLFIFLGCSSSDIQKSDLQNISVISENILNFLENVDFAYVGQTYPTIVNFLIKSSDYSFLSVENRKTVVDYFYSISSSYFLTFKNLSSLKNYNVIGVEKCYLNYYKDAQKEMISTPSNSVNSYKVLLHILEYLQCLFNPVIKGTPQ